VLLRLALREYKVNHFYLLEKINVPKEHKCQKAKISPRLHNGFTQGNLATQGKPVQKLYTAAAKKNFFAF
jgi:hypothetical protein